MAWIGSKMKEYIYTTKYVSILFHTFILLHDRFSITYISNIVSKAKIGPFTGTNLFSNTYSLESE
jgi:hypothetical protein